jgi:hypothetical protein
MTERIVHRWRAAVFIAVMGVCAVYWIAALTNGQTLRPTTEPSGFHGLIADALVRGHLDVLPAPEGLLSLPNPYDSLANGPYRASGYHDLALYHGHVYTATGATTAVLVYLPARLLGINMNPSLGTLLCAIGGFLASVGIFAECRRRFFPDLRPWEEAFVVVALGIGSPVLWLISIGRDYENAIACGYLLVAAGAYLLLRALRDPSRPVLWQLAAAGSALAAAVGARPHLVLAGLFVVASTVVIVRGRGRDRRHVRAALLALIGPYVLIGATVPLYNQARFGSFTEFGTRYQLAGSTIPMPAYPLNRAAYVPSNVFDYLLRPPHLIRKWPFVQVPASTFSGNPGRHEREPIAGVLTLYPFIVLGLMAAIAAGRSALRQAPGLVAIMAQGSMFGVLVLVAVSVPFNASTMRYAVDFAPPLALTATLAGAWAIHGGRISDTPRPRVFPTLWAGAIALSAFVGIALLVTPCPGQVFSGPVVAPEGPIGFAHGRTPVPGCPNSVNLRRR